MNLGTRALAEFGRKTRRLAIFACGFGIFGCGSALGQATNQITAISPDSAPQGTVQLQVSFTLDTDFPPAPPAGVMPISVTLGSLAGSGITHSSQYVVTAVFDIPAGETVGPKDAAVNFETPNGALVFSLAGGFNVTAGGDMPPIITNHPQSRTVPPGGSVSFSVAASGTEPLSYQWQKNSMDIDGENGTSMTIDPVSENDAGGYRCVVTNDFGTATSNEAVLNVVELPKNGYPIVDTGQDTCYDDMGVVTCPGPGATFHGQDAQHTSLAPSYTLGPSGLTVEDNNTGLTWQRSPDTDRDGDIDINDKLTWTEAQAYPAALNSEAYAGHEDWRLPSIKELYSLIDFRGIDPSGYEGGAAGLVPFIDTDYFDFAYGDTSAGERIIDSQYASSTLYNWTTPSGDLLFGVNFADGRIKGYGLSILGTDKTFLVICVRGNTDYGINNFVDNGDGTVADLATGLMWQQTDNGAGVTWEAALEYAEDLNTGGFGDWRLPNVKELQSIVDYTRSPDATASAAIDPVFSTTPITNEAGQVDYPYYWSGTTHANWTAEPGQAASYVAFGRAMGYMGFWQDVHGAGAQRSDPKMGDPADYPTGHGPQGDAIHIYNYVRCVRGPFCPQDLDVDGEIDTADFAVFAGCLAGPDASAGGGCDKADFTGDGHVDLADFGDFQAAFGGPGVAAYPGCGN